ncbi:MAG TPA: hypothetical protein VGO93_06970 [Candidatus Xenobia bacterium]|jgi:hypothetical protein
MRRSLLALLLLIGVVHAQADEPLTATRSFLTAVFVTHERKAVAAAVLDASQVDTLLKRYPAHPEAGDEIGHLKLLHDPFLTWQGTPVGKSRPGARALAEFQFHDQLAVLPLVLTAHGWKADAGYMAAPAAKAGSQAATIRRFFFAVFRKDDKTLNELTVDPKHGIPILMAANDFPGGDLDVILEDAMDMMVIPARPGDTWMMPSGRLVTASPTRPVWVGLYGTVEVPFELKEDRGHWRVVPEPYVVNLRARHII